MADVKPRVVMTGAAGNAWGCPCGPLGIGPAVDILGYKPKDNIIQSRSRFKG